METLIMESKKIIYVKNQNIPPRFSPRFGFSSREIKNNISNKSL